MMISIPVSIDDHAKECLAELLTLDGRPIAEMYRGQLEPGPHTIEFDPNEHLDEGFDAGLYVLRVTIEGQSETFPIQYMP